MKNKRGLLLLIIVLVLLIIAGFFVFMKFRGIDIKTGEEKSNLTCKSDGDCVPASCCHPKTCVAKGFEENCTDILCSMDCVPGTLDCGGGNCACIKGNCEANLK